MAFLGQTFDANELPQGNGGNYDPLPPGWYTATINKADLQPTKDGSGQYIKVRYDITGPSHQGRVVFGNLNIKNTSAKAEEIGRQQLGEIMRAIGLAKVTDTETNKHRMIRAGNQAQAIRHAAQISVRATAEAQRAVKRQFNS